MSELNASIGEQGAEEAPEPQLFGARRGWSLSRRFRSRDSYGLLLLLILATLLLFGVAGGTGLGKGLVLAALLGVLLFALWTSGAGRPLWRFALVLGPLAVVGGVIASAAGEDRAGAGVTTGAALLLEIGVLLAIGLRLVAHARVDGATVLGALCVYLLLALQFATVFAFMAAVSTGPFLQDGGTVVSAANVDQVQVLYLSLVTIATVGYGDVTMLGDLPRIVAATEGILGQLYLVTVVALLVSNLGRPRTPRVPRARRTRGERRDAEPPG